MESPNRAALDLVDEAIDFADELRVGVRHVEGDAAYLDFGVDRPGGVEAGLLLTEVATGGLATVGTHVETVAGAPLTHVELATDHPRLALVGCQSPSWELDVDGTAVRVGGPAQLLREDVQTEGSIGRDDEGDFAVCVIESHRLPGASLAAAIAERTGVPTSGVFVLVAPAASLAGRVVAASLAASGAIARVEAAGGDPAAVQTVVASAPVAPSGGDAAARSEAAVGAGGVVHLVVDGEVTEPARLVDAGADANTPAPATVTVDVLDGPTHVVGAEDEERLAELLGG